MFSRVAVLCSLVSSLASSAEISIAPGESIQIKPDQITTVSCGGSGDGRSGGTATTIVYYAFSSCTEEIFRTSQYMSPQQCAALPTRLGTNQTIGAIYRNSKCEPLLYPLNVVEACNKYAL
ncbi:MAG: hypothetical protein JST16_15800 [Bdellovibrionales bacterium]|nr:hypothetical protein [Bdellovibrionales bacterium]